MDEVTLGKRLKRARMAAGFTQGTFAAEIKLPQPVVSRIEAGQRKLTASEFIRWAEICSVSPSAIANGEDITVSLGEAAS